jgi:cytochrome c biogenesis protein
MTSSPVSKSGLVNRVRHYLKQDLLPLLADLRLAIALLLAIAVFSISGTVIEQGQTLDFYRNNYPEDPALFGFLSWKVLLTLGLDHVYRTWWFFHADLVWGESDGLHVYPPDYGPALVFSSLELLHPAATVHEAGAE